MSQPNRTTHPLTAEEFFAREHSSRCELLRGQVVELMPPGAEHGLVLLAIGAVLRAFVRGRGLGKVLGGDPGFVLARAPDTVRAPDVAFMAAESIGISAVPKGYWDIPPDLVVEVVSPGDTWTEVEAKTKQWLAFGVREVWIADPGLAEIRVLRPDAPPRVFRPGKELSTDLLPGFAASVTELLGMD